MTRPEKLEKDMEALRKSHRKTETRISRNDEKLAAVTSGQNRTDRSLALLIERQNRLDEQIAALAAGQARTDEQLRLTDAQLERTDAQLRLTDEQLRLTDAQLRLTDEQLARTDKQLEDNARQLAETKRIVSGIGVNLGDAAEDFFADALKETKTLGNIQFDSIAFRVNGHKGKVQDEFDIVLYNENSVAIIEVKHKVHPADLVALVEKKLPNFRTLFPASAGARIFLGLAGMTMPPAVAEQAETAGIAVLRQKGNTLVMNKNLRVF